MSVKNGKIFFTHCIEYYLFCFLTHHTLGSEHSHYPS